MDKSLLRQIPKVDQVLECDLLAPYLESTAREVVVDAVRFSIDEMRNAVLVGEMPDISPLVAAQKADERLKITDGYSLCGVINGTGIILHTNLGRARLAKSAAENAARIAMSYSTLEYDLDSGERGSRHDHISSLISYVTGAEAAIAVNNNAAATLLTLISLCSGKEVLVSRGESVEIGGAFRIPEIMELSGAILKDVGTTNKTHIYDYERAVSEKTAAILKVHTSNYRVIGFQEDVSVKELSVLAKEKNLPLIYDMGSGLLTDLHTYGLDEPCVADALHDGADLVLFSGDKLLGGPQAGIIAGKKEYIDRIKRHQMARPLRLDKMTLAALESTFRIYRDKKQALKEIPVLAMITRPLDEIRQKAEIFISYLGQLKAHCYVKPEIGRVGGGTAPMLDIKTFAVALRPDNMSADELEKALRSCDIPIIARISEGDVLLDMRTISDEETDIVRGSLIDILG